MESLSEQFRFEEAMVLRDRDTNHIKITDQIYP